MRAAENGFEWSAEQGVLRVVLNRPERLNAVSDATLDGIADVLERHRLDPATRVVVLTGTGRFFCAGADLAGREPAGAAPSPSTVDAAARLVESVRHLPIPVVAAVNGPALGVGTSIALAADVALARADAWFQLVFTRVGLMPDGGATALLTAAVGRPIAMRMALLGGRVSAAEAAAAGMLAAVYDEADFDTAVAATVESLRSGPAAALARTKHAVNLAGQGALDQALSVERSGQLDLLASADFQEGVTAFEARRDPVFGPRSV